MFIYEFIGGIQYYLIYICPLTPFSNSNKSPISHSSHKAIRYSSQHIDKSDSLANSSSLCVWLGSIQLLRTVWTKLSKRHNSSLLNSFLQHLKNGEHPELHDSNQQHFEAMVQIANKQIHQKQRRSCCQSMRQHYVQVYRNRLKITLQKHKSWERCCQLALWLESRIKISTFSLS